MKNIISLLFVSLLASSLIIGCGSSDGDSGNGNGNSGTKMVPGSSEDLSTKITLGGNDNKPEVLGGCKSGKSVPGCD